MWSWKRSLALLMWGKNESTSTFAIASIVNPAKIVGSKNWCSNWGPISSKWATGTEAHETISLYPCGEGLVPDAKEKLKFSTWSTAIELRVQKMGKESVCFFLWAEDGCRWSPRSLTGVVSLFPITILCNIFNSRKFWDKKKKIMI